MTAEQSIRQAWSAFGELQNELLETALSPEVGADEEDLNRLLGYLIGHLEFTGIRHLSCDPANPMLFNPQFMPWNWGNSNPDTLYLSSAVSPGHDYRVHGRLGTVAETTFGLYTGEGDLGNAVKVQAEEIETDDDGNFEILYSEEPRAGNWFEPPEGMRSFACYQTFGDWGTQRKGRIEIERLGAVSPVVPPSLEETLATFEVFIEESRRHFAMWVRDIPARVFGTLEPNTALDPFQPPSAMAGAWFSPILFRLQDDEALVIELPVPPAAPYSSVCVTDRWLTMVDPHTRQTSLNGGQWHAEADGTVRVVLAAEDPGVHNWLDSRGLRGGVVTWRTTAQSPPEAPLVTKIRKGQIDDYFDETTRVTPEQRNDALRERLRHFAYRDS